MAPLAILGKPTAKVASARTMALILRVLILMAADYRLSRIVQ